MKKRYSFRAQPTTRQERDLARLFGCCRFVYNSVVADRKLIYETGLHTVTEPRPVNRKRPDEPVGERRAFTANRQTALISDQRRRKPWLRAVSSVALIQAMQDADLAFTNFFTSAAGKRKGARVGFPRFKSRFTSRQAARFTRNGFRVDGDRVFLAKLGWIRFRSSRPLPSNPSSVTIIHLADGTWQVSFVVDVEAPDLTPEVERHAALDVGLSSFASIVYSDGMREKIANPRHLRRQERKLRRASRSLSRKVGPDKRTRQTPSNSYRAQQRVVARAHASARNARQDFARKTAHRLASENTTIAIESLNIRGLARSGGSNAQGRGLRRSIHDAAWGAFFAALDHTAAGRVIRVNPAYTSQTCSACGTSGGPKPLDIREWTCPSCGTRLDRDYNAAVNILLAAGHAERLNASGGSVRLQPTGAVARETGTQWSGPGVTRKRQQSPESSPGIPRL